MSDNGKNEQKSAQCLPEILWQAAMALQAADAQRTVELPPESAEAAAFVRGESLPCDPAWRGWTLVTTAGISLGWGKAAGGMLKNHYPKGLRKQL